MTKSHRIISALLVVLMLGSIFSGCSKKEPAVNSTAINMISSAMNISVNNNTLSSSSLESQVCAFSGSSETTVEILFSEPCDINTVVLHEDTDSVRGFTIEAEQNEEYVMVYKQDTIGTERYCTFNTVNTKGLKITVTDIKENESFKITSTEAYCIKGQGRNDFRVTAYVVGADVYKPEYFNAAALSSVTDVIIFGLTSFDISGNIVYNDITADGNAVNGKDALSRVLENLSNAEAALSRDIKIHINLLGPDAEGEYSDWDKQMAAKGDAHASAMADNKDALITNILSLINEYNFDGVYFDYEYPVKKKHLNMFSDFLVDLDKQLGDKILGAALAPWCIDLKSGAKKALDRVEIMAYDSFDSSGNHSPFYSCTVSAISTLKDSGYESEKLSLGIPFYARPADKGAYWYSYSTEAERLGKYNNAITGPAPSADDKCETRYYNSYQMVYDKTAYSYDHGIGGVMVWHLSCDLPYDNELSLFRAINESVVSRQG